MKVKQLHPAVRTACLTLIFLILGAVLVLTAGKSFTEYIRTSAGTAVELGAPVYSYDDEQKQPVEGTLKKSEVVIPSAGSRYGTIICDAVNLKAPLYYGDSEKILSRGAGQYTGSGLPGVGRMILVGAHDVGYFEVLEKAEKGQKIKVHTSYGEFMYEISDITVKDVSYINEKKLEKKGNEQLVLYTCYPFGEVFEKSGKRYFVIADKISGPELVEE